MAKIQDLLIGKNDTLDVQQILQENPWIVTPNQKCILSPDSDGLLCGLFMSHYLNWEIIGFYDGKVCLIKDGESAYATNTCFLDIECYRKGVKSVGHHMLSAYNNALPPDWGQRFSNCIQPNLIRKYDKNKFRLKYPLATIHLLISILGANRKIQLPETARFPLLFTDGTYKVMFSYPENVMNWWKFLGVPDSNHPLHNVFMGDDYPVYKLMTEMDDFFRSRDQISIKGERGDRLKISNKDNSACNIREIEAGLYAITDEPRQRCERFLKLLSEHTGWSYLANSWNFDNLKKLQFTKKDFKAQQWTIKKDNWNKFLELNPLSWAMTSGDNIEFTLEEPDSLV